MLTRNAKSRIERALLTAHVTLQIMRLKSILRIFPTSRRVRYDSLILATEILIVNTTHYSEPPTA